MSKPGKDTPEVVKFMALFAKLKDWSDDDPEGLSEFAASDESVKKTLHKALARCAFPQDERTQGARALRRPG